MRYARQIVTVTACAVVLVAGFSVWRELSPGHRQRKAADRRESAALLHSESREVFAAIPSMPVDENTTASQLREVMKEVEVVNPPPAGTNGVDNLLDLTADFLHARYVNRSLVDYTAWRAAHGYRYKPMSDVQVLVHVFYESLLHRDPPAEATVEQCIGELWALRAPNYDGAAELAAIPSSKQGYVVAFGEITPVQRARTALREHAPKLTPLQYWGGAVGATCQSWWQADPPLEQLLQSRQRLSYAEVGFIAEFRNGKKHPVFLTFVWDPEASRWRIEYLNHYNFDSDENFGIVW